MNEEDIKEILEKSKSVFKFPEMKIEFGHKWRVQIGEGNNYMGVSGKSLEECLEKFKDHNWPSSSSS